MVLHAKGKVESGVKYVKQNLDIGFIDNRENVVFIGSPGAGKTHLAIGLGLKP